MKRLKSWKGCSAHLRRLAKLAAIAVAGCIATAATAATLTVSTRTFPRETLTSDTQYRLADFVYAPGVALAGTPTAARVTFFFENDYLVNNPTLSTNYPTSNISVVIGGAGINSITFEVTPSSGTGAPANAVFTLSNIRMRSGSGGLTVPVRAFETATGNFEATATAANFQVGMVFTMGPDTDYIDLNPASPADRRRVFGLPDSGETPNRLLRGVNVSWNAGMLEPDGVTPFPDAPNTQLRLRLEGGDLSGIAQMCVDRGNQLCDPFEAADGVPSGYMGGGNNNFIIEKTPGALFTPRTFSLSVTTEWLPAASRPGIAAMVTFSHPAMADNTWPIVEGNAGTPVAPVIGSAVAGAGQASVSFSPPADDGGSPVTGYEVTSSPGGVTANGASSPITVGGLAGGTTYTFTVRAFNGVGAGPPSAPSNAVVPTAPASVPGAPTITSISAGDRQVSIAFSPPASDGGSPILAYEAVCQPGALITAGTQSPLVVQGLTNGTSYSCTVTAINAQGRGAMSGAATATPIGAATAPAAPEITRAVAEDQAILFEFLPAAANGSPVTGYEASCQPGAITVSAAQSPIRITGLANGTEYTCTLRARNALGAGPATEPLRLTPKVPPFPIAVTYSITPTTASAAAQIQYRQEDVGRNGNVFVFALAPAPLVRNGGLALKVGYAKNTPIPCVLAQMSANGQLEGVSASNLGAALQGILSAQGAAVTILDNANRANVAGSTFFVGYGNNSQSMIESGTNRAALTVPAPVECRPQAPATGWWWNPLEDGRGYSVEVRGNNIFFAAFLYDTSGRSTWLVSTGAVSLEGALYSGDLLGASGGQTLGGPYPGFPTLRSEGNVTLVFNTQNAGVMVWPGGAVPIQRFDIVPNGLGAVPVPGQPESGWWWNEQEPGRGFFMEWQGGTLDIAGYMYDDSGNPVWYLTVGDLAGSPQARTFSGNWWSYANGQTLRGAWKPHSRTSANVAPLSIQFTARDAAIMTLPNGRTTTLRRHRF